jgi:hypothetical protein
MTRAEHRQARRQRNKALHAARQMVAACSRLDALDVNLSADLLVELLARTLSRGVDGGTWTARHVLAEMGAGVVAGRADDSEQSGDAVVH